MIIKKAPDKPEYEPPPGSLLYKSAYLIFPMKMVNGEWRWLEHVHCAMIMDFMGCTETVTTWNTIAYSKDFSELQRHALHLKNQWHAMHPQHPNKNKYGAKS